MPTQVIRQNGQLLETQLDTQQLSKLQGQPVGPATPAGAQDLGANPDQAKMVGTPAQQGAQQPVLEDQTKPQQTLQQAQRTQAPRAQATDAEEKAQGKAAQLQQLGSLQTRVQDLITAELKSKEQGGSLNTAQAELATAELQAQPEEKRVALETALQKVLASPKDPAVLAEATQAWVDAGLGTVKDFTPEKFVAVAKDTLGKSAATNVRDTVQVGNLPLAEQEAASLTEVFGDRWKSFTVPELQKEIESLRQAEFNRVQALRAELASAQPGSAQQKMLQQELTDLGQVGATGVETQVKQLKQQIDKADLVKVGDTSYRVGDLLADKKISQIVSDMLGDEELKEKVRKTNPDFVAWVEKNQQALAELAADVKKSQGVVRDVWDQKQALKTIGGGELSDKIMRELVPDWDKVTATVPNIDNVGFIARLRDLKEDPKMQQEMLDDLNEAANDPALLRKLKGLGAADFQAAWSAGNALADPLVAELTGLGGPFVVDDREQGLVAKMKNIADTIKQTGLPEGVYVDPSFKQLIKSGDIGADQIKMLASRPDPMGFYTSYKSYVGKHAAVQQAMQSADIDKVLDITFGRDIDVKALNDEYALLRKYAAVDPAMAQRLNEIKRLDANNSGSIDPNDAALLGKGLLTQLSGGYGENQQSLGGLLKSVSVGGGDPFRNLGGPMAGSKLDDRTTAQTIQQSGSLFDKLSKALGDGKITEAEIGDIAKEQGGLDKLFGGHFAKQLSGQTRQTYQQTLTRREGEKGYAEGTKAAMDLSKRYFGDTAVSSIGNRFSDPFYVFPPQDEQWVRQALQELDSVQNRQQHERGKTAVHELKVKLSTILDDNERNKKNVADRRRKEEEKLAAEAKAKMSQAIKATTASTKPTASNLGKALSNHPVSQGASAAAQNVGSVLTGKKKLW